MDPDVLLNWVSLAGQARILSKSPFCQCAGVEGNILPWSLSHGRRLWNICLTMQRCVAVLPCLPMAPDWLIKS